MPAPGRRSAAGAFFVVEGEATQRPIPCQDLRSLARQSRRDAAPQAGCPRGCQQGVGDLAAYPSPCSRYSSSHSRRNRTRRPSLARHRNRVFSTLPATSWGAPSELLGHWHLADTSPAGRSTERVSWRPAAIDTACRPSLRGQSCATLGRLGIMERCAFSSQLASVRTSSGTTPSRRR